MNAVQTVIALIAIALTTVGCASTPKDARYKDDTATGMVVGGLLGSAIKGSKGAKVGAAAGAAIGALVDHGERKNDERAAEVRAMMRAKTGGAGNPNVANAIAQAEAEIARAETERERCEARYLVYRDTGHPKPYRCDEAYREALRRAQYATHVGNRMYHNPGIYDGIRLDSPHAAFWIHMRENPYYPYR